MTVRITAATFCHKDLARLVGQLDEYQSALYPAASNHCIALADMSRDRAWAWLATVGDYNAGCVCLYHSPDGQAEIKRLYVDPDYRGYGLASALLAELEALARQQHCPALYLETGIHQPDAVGLYKKLGFIRTGAFGQYTDDPLSIYMSKALD
ncbi:GNAT family N-acetyltransferase [Sodalis sp. RH21]|uniref:GNAT family N-acetyltransferase n=1 Tax=unclassified Sodalis (in: enterobacteria) TaxID=2636512 RepID=UPI0039B57047